MSSRSRFWLTCPSWRPCIAGSSRSIFSSSFSPLSVMRVATIPPILAAALPDDEARRLHAVEEPRDIGHFRHEPLPHFVAAEPLVPGAAENPQHVVLRDREIERLQRLRAGVLEEGRRPRDAENGLLLHRLEGLGSS